MSDRSDENAREEICKGYGDIAEGRSNCCCGSSSPQSFTESLGYSADQLETLPAGANMGLSCGNPTAAADLKPGQHVLDLGSGGGLDVFVAAARVGPAGSVTGVDMTTEMIRKARAGIPEFSKKTDLSNVEFRLGEIEHLPVADATMDVVISNCVINLSPDKQQVWNEISRVLKRGGKACISDIALKRPLPEKILESAAALVSCVAGAVLIEDTIRMAEQAGLINLRMEKKAFDFDYMTGCSDTLREQVIEYLPPGASLNDYVTSINITARKPA